MTREHPKNDLLGLKPYGEATKVATEGMSAFFGKICMPAAEELGLYLQDNMREFRRRNLVAISEKASTCLRDNAVPESHQANPSLVISILEKAAWIEDSVVQDMWAGLISSSCTNEGDDDSNLIFVNLLSQLSKVQVRLLKMICEEGEKYVHVSGLFVNDTGTMTFFEIDKIEQITCEDDLQRLDREIDHLRELGLISGSLRTNHPIDGAALNPTALGLHLYIRSQGSRLTPGEFFQLEP